MQRSREVLLACLLSRSAFSGERIFRVVSADGSEHIGVASTNHCRRRDGRRIGEDEPPKGARIEGLVEGVIVDEGDGIVAVAVPDGETIRVEDSMIRFTGSGEAAKYVPV